MTKNREKWERQRAERIREEEIYKSMVLDTTKWHDNYHETWEEYRARDDEFNRLEEEEDRLFETPLWKEYRNMVVLMFLKDRAAGAPPRGPHLSWEEYKKLNST